MCRCRCTICIFELSSQPFFSRVKIVGSERGAGVVEYPVPDARDVNVRQVVSERSIKWSCTL